MEATSDQIFKTIDYVIGTQKDVCNRREISLIAEELVATKNLKCIVSGSFAEGVYSEDSDIDFMIDFSQWIACPLSEDRVQNNQNIHFYMIPSPQNHGYCMLLCQDRHLVTGDIFEVYEGNYYLSSNKIKSYMYGLLPKNFVVHGPCLQRMDDTAEVEFAFCLKCPSWPEVANEWLSRPRATGWPDDSIIRKIKKKSCHVVPIGLPDSPTNSIEWRISFSLAERTLVHSFNRTQFVVYCILKQITKEIIGKQVPNVMCSYFIKTVLFYSIESSPATIWRKQNLQECLHRCIRVLYRFIDDLYCPHYFIRHVNLFKFKVTSQNQRDLLKEVKSLLDMSLQHILSRIKTFGVVGQVTSSRIELLSYLKYRINVQFLAYYRSILYNTEFTDVLTSVKNVIHKSQISSSNTLAHVSAMLFTSLADSIHNSHSTTRNITQYRVDKLLERFYKLGTKFDVTSGRLRLASFYLMAGNVNSCLNVIRSVLRNMSHLFVSIDSSDLKSSYSYIFRTAMSGKGLSPQQQFWSCSSLASVYVCTHANVPLAIQYQIWENILIFEMPKGRTVISPLMHAYFLQALCYIELCDLNKLDVTVNMLKETLKNGSALHKDSRHNDYNLLGYILMKQGNIRDAVKYHVKSYYWKSKHQRENFLQSKYSAAVLRIMCCLCHRLYPSQTQEEFRR